VTTPPTILYIEDNRDNQRLVRRVLEANGYTVLLAEDGPLGLALARETSPALILVDINIPGLDGYETTTRLRSMPHLQGVPIVALTAHTSPDARDRSLVAGCDGYLLKPIDVRLLPTQVAEFIGGRREAVPSEREAPLLREHSTRLVERLEQQVRQLRMANTELQELDRLKSQFLASLSHELRTPLTSIKGFLELFAIGALDPLNEAQREAISVMSRNVETLTRQLNNLLYLQESRNGTLQRQPCHLAALVERLALEVKPSANAAGVALEYDLPTDDPPTKADVLALEQAFRNLLDNAVRYTPQGGRVQIVLREDTTRALLTVEDSGIGMPGEVLDKIFLPFYRVDPSLARPYSGAGIGLAIVKHVVEAHNGQITVRSVPGEGSRFTVMLPRETHE
jgi:signal transduction histidine kinase